jgi:hypothetical protein
MGQQINKKTLVRTAFGLSSSGGELALVIAKGGNDIGATSSLGLPMIGTMTITITLYRSICYQIWMEDGREVKRQITTSRFIDF